MQKPESFFLKKESWMTETDVDLECGHDFV